MIIIVKPEQLEDANKWFRDNINPEGGDNFDQPVIDSTTGLVTGYWASVNLTKEQEKQVSKRFAFQGSNEAKTTKMKDGSTRLGLKYEAMSKDEVMISAKVRAATDEEIAKIKKEKETKIKEEVVSK